MNSQIAGVLQRPQSAGLEFCFKAARRNSRRSEAASITSNSGSRLVSLKFVKRESLSLQNFCSLE
jgi:hypothetical protein